MVAVTGGSAYDLRTRSAKASVVRSSQASFPPLTALTLESALPSEISLRMKKPERGPPPRRWLAPDHLDHLELAKALAGLVREPIVAIREWSSIPMSARR